MKTKLYSKKAGFLLSILVLTGGLNGCATNVIDPDDPWEDWNRDVDSFNKTVDDTVLKPMAEGYLWTTPEPIDQGVTNFFSNIQDIGVTLNDYYSLNSSRRVWMAAVSLLTLRLGLPALLM